MGVCPTIIQNLGFWLSATQLPFILNTLDEGLIPKNENRPEIREIVKHDLPGGFPSVLSMDQQKWTSALVTVPLCSASRYRT